MAGLSANIKIESRASRPERLQRFHTTRAQDRLPNSSMTKPVNQKVHHDGLSSKENNRRRHEEVLRMQKRRKAANRKERVKRGYEQGTRLAFSPCT